MAARAAQDNDVRVLAPTPRGSPDLVGRFLKDGRRTVWSEPSEMTSRFNSTRGDYIRVPSYDSAYSPNSFASDFYGGIEPPRTRKPSKSDDRFFRKRTLGEEEFEVSAKSWIIIPGESNTAFKVWELFTMGLLFSAAFLVPFDTMVQTDPRPTSLFAFNLMLDIVFLTDILIRFRLAHLRPDPLVDIGTFEDSDDEDGHSHLWETNPLAIAKRYCSWPLSEGGDAGWFWIDALASAPPWFLRATGRDPPSFVRSFRLLRLLRLGRLVDRMHRYMGMTGISLNVSSLIELILYSTLAFHWMGCIMVGFSGCDWSDSWDEDGNAGSTDNIGSYGIFLYWAIVTLTSIGYGDFVVDSTQGYVLSSTLMLVSAFVWAFIIGSIFNLIGDINMTSARFRQEFSDWQEFAEERMLAGNIKKEAQAHMLWSKVTSKLADQESLIRSSLSPNLRRELHDWFRGHMLNEVWWARSVSSHVREELCGRMTREHFGQKESCIPPRSLIFVKSGRVRANLETIEKDGMWGGHRILHTKDQILYSRTLTRVDAIFLKQGAVKDVCDTFPGVGIALRRWQVRLVVMSGIRRLAEEVKRKRRVEKNGVTSRNLPCVFSFSKPGFHRSLTCMVKEVMYLNLELEAIKVQAKETQELVQEHVELASRIRNKLDVQLRGYN